MVGVPNGRELWRSRLIGYLVPLAAAIVLVFVTWPQMQSTLAASLRYRAIDKVEWDTAKVWLESARCARQTGALLSICQGARLAPISDLALAEDPGHALLLGMLAKFDDKDVDFSDVARINLFINAAGLFLLVAILFGLRLHIAAVLLLAFGSARFLSWTEVLPHWSFIGLTAMQTVLPLTLLARDRRWMSSKLSTGFMVVGFAALGFATLVREAIATMSVIVTLLVGGWLAWTRFRQGRSMIPLAFVVALTIGMTTTPQLVIGARNLLWNVQPAQFIAAHGMSHTLYIGLGNVPNKFGIVYDDVFGYRAAVKDSPGVYYQSPEYLTVMRRLYLRRVLEDPLEVARIYFEKFKIVLGHWFLGSLALPLWGSLPLLVGIQFLCNRGASPADRRFVEVTTGVNVIALSFIGLTVLQSTLAVPNMFYAMPIALLLLLMLSVGAESVLGFLRRRVSPYLPA